MGNFRNDHEILTSNETWIFWAKISSHQFCVIWRIQRFLASKIPEIFASYVPFLELPPPNMVLIMLCHGPNMNELVFPFENLPKSNLRQIRIYTNPNYPKLFSENFAKFCRFSNFFSS